MRLWIVVFVALFLAACNVQTVDQYEKMQDEERSLESKNSQIQEDTVTEQQSEKKTAVQDEKDASVSPKNEEKPVQKDDEQQVEQPKTTQEEKSNVKSEPQAKKEPTPTKEQASPKPTNEPKKQSEKPKAETPKQPQAEKPVAPAEKKRTVTIGIRVDTLLKHWDKLDPSLQSNKYVPRNGAILQPVTYELLSEKDTVWDVLLRATKEHKIQMEYQGANENIYNSVYVEGINHLYEFSAGELSGWMYKVNGVYPNYGCSQYVLKDGDVIEWNYTVDLGRDLGQ